MCDEMNEKLSKLAADVDECLDRVASVEAYGESLEQAERIYNCCSVDIERVEAALKRRLSELESMLLRDKPAVRFAKALIDFDRAVNDDTCRLCGVDFSFSIGHNPGCAVADAETYLDTNASGGIDD